MVLDPTSPRAVLGAIRAGDESRSSARARLHLTSRILEAIGAGGKVGSGLRDYM